VDKADFQWICHIQKFQFFKLVVVKELAIICIQTGEVKTWHVTPGVAVDVDFLDRMNQALYKAQFDKHRLGWHDGNVTMTELKKELHDLIDENSVIFVTSSETQDVLDKLGFNDVHFLTMPPVASFGDCPSSTCGEYGHVQGFTFCSQRACVEILIHLRPLLLPYLFEDFAFRGGNYTDTSYKCLHFQLGESLYDALGKLHDNAVYCGQLRMAWADATEKDATQAGKVSFVQSTQSGCQGGLASAPPAGTSGN
jgi:hypothetical protein